jgi:hypothetical protein
MTDAKEQGGFKAPPIFGYKDVKPVTQELVDANKEREERLLRAVDEWNKINEAYLDHRWLAIARTHFQQGFMAMNRAIFKPQRISLPEDVAVKPQPPSEVHGAYKYKEPNND